MDHSKFSVDAIVTIYRDNEIFIGPNQYRLLKQILADGSINAAAKNLKMSYQHAWHLIDKINRLSPIPVVIRQKGGKDGGGCSLSPYGMQVLESYAMREIEIIKLLEQTNSELESCFF
ncbi:winged helix-turn-helix domain-containing protein [uncultured Bacteroides sp.]|jgi:N-terminal domain of molybdenum-binding protein|uniref:winged helix-turn-helix domain-containing protein n=1 Tax=uncultured Bacteroides sp. TaxID=162156 RepID=UPI002AABD2D2|nr:winged helix-turn-helix domain-containing protein [uncultured Bacteroides sp.]